MTHVFGRRAAVVLLLGGTLLATEGDPAGATVAASASGTRVVVAASGPETVAFSCDAASSTLLVNDVPTTPPISCATVTEVSVSGDRDAQTVDGRGLDAPAFAAGPRLDVRTGAGADVVYGSKHADAISTDLAIIGADGAVDSSVIAERVRILGTPGDDTLTVLTLAPQTPFTPSGIGGVQSNIGGAVVTRPLSTSKVELHGLDGDDTLQAAGSVDTVNAFAADGGPGDDTIDAGGEAGVFDGGSGTNTILGSAGFDTITTRSETDTIDGRGGGDVVVDATSARSFGRTIASPKPYGYELDPEGDLGAVRVRPSGAPGGAIRITASGNRPGQMDLWPETTSLRLVQRGGDGAYDATLFDVVLHPGTKVDATGRAGGQDLFDLTIPSGTWTQHDEYGLTVIETEGAGLPTPIALRGMDEVSVHGPWTDLDEGFVHRVVRDLAFTFLDANGRTQRANAIKAGTLTRAGLVDQILGDKAYRGLEVERSFLRYLHRGADPKGQTYWVASLGGGKAPWRFRAQLLGSNEYFAKAGGANAAWLARAYTDVLGRTPDPAGQAYWTAKLDRGAERGMVALQFINAAETRRRLVDDQYLRFLDRLPTAGEQADGVALLLQASGEQQLIRSLAIGTEYYQRS